MSDERVVPKVTSTFNLSKHIARYNSALAYCDHARVLDAACGTGYGTHLLGMVASEVVGWDIDQGAIDFALSNFGGKNISYYKVDLEKEIDSCEPFGVIVSFETLEHLNDPEKAVKMLTGRLTQDGLFIASIPLNELKGQNEYHKNTFILDDARKLFSGMNMVQELIQAGLSFYPAEYASEFPDEMVYYIYMGRV